MLKVANASDDKAWQKGADFFWKQSAKSAQYQLVVTRYVSIFMIKVTSRQWLKMLKAQKPATLTT